VPGFSFGTKPSSALEPSSAAGPGPGEYDSTPAQLQRAAPAFSFGTSSRAAGMEGEGEGPGPGEYQRVSSRPSGPAFSIQPRRGSSKEAEAALAPGPGAWVRSACSWQGCGGCSLMLLWGIASWWGLA
jgi:hypothetical protein